MDGETGSGTLTSVVTRRRRPAARSGGEREPVELFVLAVGELVLLLALPFESCFASCSTTDLGELHVAVSRLAPNFSFALIKGTTGDASFDGLSTLAPNILCGVAWGWFLTHSKILSVVR